jgi:hypothetical protein
MQTSTRIYKKAPDTTERKTQVGCRVPDSVYSKLHDEMHANRYTSFSAFLETLLINHINDQDVNNKLRDQVQKLQTSLEQSLTAIKGSGGDEVDALQARFYYFNELCKLLDVSPSGRKKIMDELIKEQPDAKQIIQQMKGELKQYLPAMLQVKDTEEYQQLQEANELLQSQNEAWQSSFDFYENELMQQYADLLNANDAKFTNADGKEIIVSTLQDAYAYLFEQIKKQIDKA